MISLAPILKRLLVLLLAVTVGCTDSSIEDMGARAVSGKTKKEKEKEKEDKKKREKQLAGGRDAASEAQASIASKALDDASALAFFKENCTSCHGKGQDLHSTWPVPDDDKLSAESLQNMQSIATAYQGLVNKLSNVPVGHRPSPMPPAALDEEKKKQLEGLIYWFQLNMPSVVKEAEDTYGATEQFGSTLAVNLSYQCDKRSDARSYVYRLFNTALGRVPTGGELDTHLPASERAQTLTNERRRLLATLVTEGELKEEFLSYGLRIFAKRVGGAGAIKSNPAFGLTDAAANDLKEEFYQLVRAYVEEKSYRDILLLDRVKVTSNTFAFYNTPEAPCVDPGAGIWGECMLSPKRGNFFGTMAFLRSTPSSFLASNNNYKRGGEIHAILRGERLMAQTDGPPGAEPDPLPACMTTNDNRVVLNKVDDPSAGTAPRGALAVPRQGSVCQGCHLQKYLGIASYVYRQFDENGLLLTAAQMNPTDRRNPYADMVKAATTPDILNSDGISQTPVDSAYLQSLLAEQDAGHEECITDRSGKNTVKTVKNIEDLVQYMMGDGKILVHGLARYVPSALSNMSLTNQEIIAAMSRGFDDGNGRLLPVFRAYFESETFSCSVGGEQ
jgi:mono/diheme cytochrome c family protein